MTARHLPCDCEVHRDGDTLERTYRCPAALALWDARRTRLRGISGRPVTSADLEPEARLLRQHLHRPRSRRRTPEPYGD